MTTTTSAAVVEEALVPAEPSTSELRLLDPKRLRVFEHAGLTRMTHEGDRSWIRVQIARALPISAPERFFGVLDGAGRDVGMIREPSLLDAESRQVVDAHLERRYFAPVVEKVLSAKEEFGAVYWRLQTSRGVKDVVARNLRENLQELSATRVLMTDVDGNRYEFPDLDKVDPLTLSVILRHL